MTPYNGLPSMGWSYAPYTGFLIRITCCRQLPLIMSGLEISQQEQELIDTARQRLHAETQLSGRISQFWCDVANRESGDALSGASNAGSNVL